MMNILVGIDGTERGIRAARWALAHAKRDGGEVTLLAVIDNVIGDHTGLESDVLENAIQKALDDKVAEIAPTHQGVKISTRVVSGPVIESIVKISADYDMIAVGSHHGRSISDVIGGAKGLRIAVAAPVPTVVVPADWDAEAAGSGIVTGVGPGEPTDAPQLEFAALEAEDQNDTLTVVGSWGASGWIQKTAQFMGANQQKLGDVRKCEIEERVIRLAEKHPQLQITPCCVENPSAAHALIEASEGSTMLVLGTDDRSVIKRKLFGGVAHSVLSSLHQPTAIVPKA
jgi:nucleotide-binding universal stress UspA family protein